MCDEPLNSIKVQDQGRLVACGSHQGTTTLIELSDSLCTLLRHEKSTINAVRISFCVFVFSKESAKRASEWPHSLNSLIEWFPGFMEWVRGRMAINVGVRIPRPGFNSQRVPDQGC